MSRADALFLQNCRDILDSWYRPPMLIFDR